MVGELWEEGAAEPIDDDIDDDSNPLDDELETDDLQMWCMLRRYLPTKPEPRD